MDHFAVTSEVLVVVDAFYPCACFRQLTCESGVLSSDLQSEPYEQLELRLGRRIGTRNLFVRSGGRGLLVGLFRRFRLISRMRARERPRLRRLQRQHRLTQPRTPGHLHPLEEALLTNASSERTRTARAWEWV